MDKRRSRIISFRISSEEYEALKNLSISRGSRSISEFTRSVACQPDSDGIKSVNNNLDGTLENLNKVITELDHQVRQLTRILDRSGKSENNKA